jgi:integrase
MKTHEMFPSLKGKTAAVSRSPGAQAIVRQAIALGQLVDRAAELLLLHGDVVSHSPTYLSWVSEKPVLRTEPLRSAESESKLAAAPSSAGREKTLPRRRYQRGRLFSQGKKRRQWVASFREDRIDPITGNIRRVRRSVRLGLVKHMTKAQALVEFQKRLDAVNLVPQPIPKTGRTLRSFSEEWEQHVGVTLKPSTLRAIKSHLRTHILPRIGDLPLTGCTTKNIQAFISGLAVTGLARKTIENVLTSLHSLLGTAKKWDYIPTVFEHSALYLPEEGEQKEARFFDAEQVRRIIGASKEPFATMYAVLACTGVRAGECLGLQVTDLDFDKRLIKIRRTLDAYTRKTHAPKSKASSGDLPMPDNLARRLRNYLAHHWRKNAAGWLFCNRRGNPYARDKVAYKLQATLRELGIEKAGLHAFRHMAASELLESGAAPSVVQKQMRHADSRITLQTYAHVIGDAQRRAVESLAQSVLGDSIGVNPLKWSQNPRN